MYGLKPDGTIVEWQYDGSWTGPSVLGPRADPGTTLAVVHTENNSGVHVSVPKKKLNPSLNADEIPQIRLYYHADGRIKELCYEKQWINGAVLP